MGRLSDLLWKLGNSGGLDHLELRRVLTCRNNKHLKRSQKCILSLFLSVQKTVSQTHFQHVCMTIYDIYIYYHYNGSQYLYKGFQHVSTILLVMQDFATIHSAGQIPQYLPFYPHFDLWTTLFFRSRHPYRTRRAGSCRSRTTPESSVGPSCTGVTFWQVSCRSGDTLKGCYGTGCDELNGCCMDVTDITPTKWMVNMWCEWMVLSFFEPWKWCWFNGHGMGISWGPPGIFPVYLCKWGDKNPSNHEIKP